MNYMDNYNLWLTSSAFDAATKAELENIKENDGEIKERFYKELEFGTGGLRGIIGAGTNRMNIYTVRRATQGFANFLKNQSHTGENAVVIAYDSRRMSKEFADETALVMCANGLKAYVFETLRPTPELSFAVRHLKAKGGIVITASHNPPEYNGYKVYGADGGQVPPPFDGEIIDEVNKVIDFASIPIMNKNTAISENLYISIGEEVDEAYYEAVLEGIINKSAIEAACDMSIIYTPLHGTGNIPVSRVLEKAGFKNVHIVKQQQEPDSEFTTVSYPNPEEPKVFNLALELAREKNGEIIVGTDPDADRVGVMVKNKTGEFIPLTGNMTGVLLADYILGALKEKNALPKDGVVISTVVSSNMTRKIADFFEVSYEEVLTGFKFIGEKIKEMEVSGKGTYLFGFEESYGCLAGTYARDKDAVAATLLVCEMAAYYRLKGMSLYDGLLKAYEKYGFHREKVESITLKGIEGSETIGKIMASMRANPPAKINAAKVKKIYDYSESVEKDLVQGTQKEITLPKSNVLYYEMDDESWLCVRPSGTEPKIKIYFGTVGENLENADENLEKLGKSAMELIDDKKN